MPLNDSSERIKSLFDDRVKYGSLYEIYSLFTLTSYSIGCMSSIRWKYGHLDAERGEYGRYALE